MSFTFESVPLKLRTVLLDYLQLQPENDIYILLSSDLLTVGRRNCQCGNITDEEMLVTGIIDLIVRLYGFELCVDEIVELFDEEVLDYSIELFCKHHWCAFDYSLVPILQQNMALATRREHEAFSLQMLLVDFSSLLKWWTSAYYNTLGDPTLPKIKEVKLAVANCINEKLFPLAIEQTLLASNYADNYEADCLTLMDGINNWKELTMWGGNVTCLKCGNEHHEKAADLVELAAGIELSLHEEEQAIWDSIESFGLGGKKTVPLCLDHDLHLTMGVLRTYEDQENEVIFNIENHKTTGTLPTLNVTLKKKECITSYRASIPITTGKGPKLGFTVVKKKGIDRAFQHGANGRDLGLEILKIASSLTKTKLDDVRVFCGRGECQSVHLKREGNLTGCVYQDAYNFSFGVMKDDTVGNKSILVGIVNDPLLFRLLQLLGLKKTEKFFILRFAFDEICD